MAGKGKSNSGGCLALLVIGGFVVFSFFNSSSKTPQSYPTSARTPTKSAEQASPQLERVSSNAVSASTTSWSSALPSSAISQGARVIQGNLEVEMPAGLMPVEVLSVTDGDTIRVDYNGTNTPLRYIGIDTPERNEQYFNEATTYNWRLVAGQTVYLEKDVSETDRYDRLLRYVWLSDGRLVNEELVRAGWALSSTYPPDVKYQQAFLAAQQSALEAENGFWGNGELVNPIRSVPAASPTSTPVPQRVVTNSPTCNAGSNFRGGPGTDYPRVGGCREGDAVAISGRNQAGDWLQLTSGAWIFASLVDNAPSGLSVASSPPTPMPAPTAVPTPVPVVVQLPPQRSQPVGNCDPSYPDVCIPSPPPDLDCGDIPYSYFRVVGSDPHRFDGNHDGEGCES